MNDWQHQLLTATVDIPTAATNHKCSAGNFGNVIPIIPQTFLSYPVAVKRRYVLKSDLYNNFKKFQSSVSNVNRFLHESIAQIILNAANIFVSLQIFYK